MIFQLVLMLIISVHNINTDINTHNQATVKVGFSVNKTILKENMDQQLKVSRHCIKDYMHN